MTRRWTAAMAEPPFTSPYAAASPVPLLALGDEPAQTPTHDVEGPPDVSAVDRNDDEQSRRRHPQLHAPKPSPSRTVLTLEPVASHAQAGASLYGKIGMLVLVAGAQARNWVAPCSRCGSQRHHSSRTSRNRHRCSAHRYNRRSRRWRCSQHSQKPEPHQVVCPQPQTKPTPAPEALTSVLVAARSWSMSARSR